MAPDARDVSDVAAMQGKPLFDHDEHAALTWIEAWRSVAAQPFAAVAAARWALPLRVDPRRRAALRTAR
jgi:hypothetical protein